MPGENRRDDQDQQEGGQEDADGRDQRAPESGDEVADESGRDDDRTRADHPDRDGDQELPRVEPPGLLHQPLFEKGHDDEAAAEGQAPGFEEEGEQLAEHGGRRRLRRADA